MSATTRDILDFALSRIRANGWSFRYSTGPTAPMNIRSAIAKGCTHYHGSGKAWYDAYLEAVNVVNGHLTTGIQNWECPPIKTGRSQAEVEKMLIDVIEKLPVTA